MPVPTETVAAPYIGAVVLYSFGPRDPDGRGSDPAAGLPQCPAVVLEVDPYYRVKARLFSEYTTEVRGLVSYSADGQAHTWRWPDKPAAG